MRGLPPVSLRKEMVRISRSYGSLLTGCAGTVTG